MRVVLEPNAGEPGALLPREEAGARESVNVLSEKWTPGPRDVSR